VHFQALRDHVIPSASDARVTRNGMQHPYYDSTYAFCSSPGKMKVPRVKHLIILDDLMDETDQRVALLFTKKSHHRNISVMYIVQNLFHHRTISLNAHYMVLFQNLTDVSQIMALAHQMYPRRTQFFLEAFARATAKPHVCKYNISLPCIFKR
jgi:hypothetical protein